ncbi:DUF6516 family protein [Roseomonas sp. BN140053]|uniref:toxin-antitoxin system TumE family protein n=1 Tax=Roseomonas sp. BN140053 TaxID=3391898 RepID=UPI0039EBEB78
MLIRDRRVFDDGAILEVVVWRVPVAVPPSTHGLKYRLVYVRDGERLAGYDNERGKGNHRHLGGREEDYGFTSLSQLLNDFEADVVALRGEPI